MSDSSSSSSAPVSASPTVETNVVSGIVAPVSNAKPYDDEIFQKYTEDASETAKEEAPKVIEQKTEEEPEAGKEEEANPDEPNGATKNDKVDDGFEEVPITKLINGKEVQFKVKDAINAYLKQETFNRDMDRRLTKVSQREQAWEKDQQSFKGNLGKLIEVAQKGDFITAVKGLAKIATHGTDLDPTDFEKQYFEQLDKVREVYTKMTPEQREAYFAKRSLSEAQQRARQLEEEKNFTVQSSQLQEKVQTLQQEYGIPNEEFWGNFKSLSEGLMERGVIKSPNEIQPEHVIGHSLEVRRQIKLFEAAEKTGLSDADKLEYLSKVTAADPSLTVDEIVNIIKNSQLVDVAPADVVENLNRKVGASRSQFSQASSTKKDERTAGYDKEDLEYLYRKQPKGYSRR